MQLAAAGWNVIAVDASAKRLERLRANMERTGLAAEIVQGDIRSWETGAPVDEILLDAPCSATGIFRRLPDVLHRVEPRPISSEESRVGKEGVSKCSSRWPPYH